MESKYERGMLIRVGHTYRSIYEAMLVEADGDYAHILQSEFGPSSRNWEDQQLGTAPLCDLIHEVYKSSQNADELLVSAGVDYQLKAFIGFSAPEGDDEELKRAKRADKWLRELSTLPDRSIVETAKKIPSADYTVPLITAIRARVTPGAFIMELFDCIPSSYTSRKEVLVSLAKENYHAVKYLPRKGYMTKDVAEALLEEVGMKVLQYLPEDICKELYKGFTLAENPLKLACVPKQQRTMEMLNAAILAAAKLPENEVQTLHKADWFKWAVNNSTPGDVNTLSLEAKLTLARLAPKTLSCLARAGAFYKKEDGSFSDEAWELFFEGMRWNPAITLQHAPVEMAQKCADYYEFCFLAKAAKNN